MEALGGHRLSIRSVEAWQALARSKAARTDAPRLQLLDEAHPWVYIKIEKPKSRRRGARIQHVKLNEPAAVRFLEKTWANLPPDELVYPGSPNMFRRRWDEILAILGLPRSLGLTPASLRPGGAISAFQKGVAVNDLLWRMRLQSLATLEFYLQEMSAVSILPSLDADTRRNILSSASLHKACLRA